MPNITYNQAASLAVSGITPTPTTAPKQSLVVTSSFAAQAESAGDYFENTFLVNANTPATAIALGKIVTGYVLWIQSSGSFHVTLTQDLGAGPVDNTVAVEDFFYSNTPFTALQITNPNGTAINVSIAVLGDRVAPGTGPGIY